MTSHSRAKPQSKLSPPAAVGLRALAENGSLNVCILTSTFLVIPLRWLCLSRNDYSSEYMLAF